MASSYTQAAPPSFFCPISFELMQDPVCTVDGHTYERAEIQVSNTRAKLIKLICGILLNNVLNTILYHLSPICNKKGVACRRQRNVTSNRIRSAVDNAGP